MARTNWTKYKTFRVDRPTYALLDSLSRQTGLTKVAIINALAREKSPEDVARLVIDVRAQAGN